MQTTDDILFSAHGPDPIPTATTEIVGTPGNARNVYWIVSHFPIGSVVSGPFPQKDSPNVLDDENYVHISWPATLGASSYDLLFTRELQLPRQPGRFLLAANLTSTEFRDIGQDLDLYDLAGIRYGAPQQEWIYFDNRDRKQPTLRFIPWPIEVSSIIFEDGSSQNTAGGGGLPAPPNESIQFNNNGAFGGSPNLIWDNIDSRMGIGTQNPQAQLEVAASGNGLRVRNFPGSSSNTEGVWISQFGGLRGFISGGTYGGYHELDIDGFPVLLCRQDQSGGNVGIGVLNPQSKLDVFDSINISATASSELPPAQPGPGNSWSLSFSNLNILATDQRVARISVNTESFIDSGVLMFQTANAGVLAERMRIDATGNVGIGRQNPQAKLDVAGDISLSGDINSIISHPTTAADLYFNVGRDIWVNARQIVLNNTNFLVAGSATLNFSSSGSLGGTLGSIGLSTTYGMLFDSGQPIIFRVPNGSEVMRIDGSGIFLSGPTGGRTVFSVDSFDTLQITNVGGVQASSFRTDLVQGGALVVQSTGTFLTISGLYTNLTVGNTLTITAPSLFIVGLPTSPTGLASGQIWNNAGVLSIV